MSLEKLNAADILDLMADGAKYKIDVFNELTSTNDYLFEQVKTGAMNANVVLAEMQTAGRGRQGNKWNSAPGNILLSLHHRFTCELKRLYGLSLVVGVAVARVLKTNGLHDVKLKWPNDVYWNSRKMAGVLIETKQDGKNVDAIIGLGLNVQDQTADQFVCLEDALQHKVYRNKLTAQLLSEIQLVLEQFEDEGFDVFKDEWNTFVNSSSQLDAMADQKIDKHKMI